MSAREAMNYYVTAVLHKYLCPGSQVKFTSTGGLYMTQIQGDDVVWSVMIEAEENSNSECLREELE